VTDQLRWGILGTGRIAAALAKGIAGTDVASLQAIGSRAQATADAFGDTWNVPNRHATYEGLLADPQVDAVYIALPNHLHAPWAIAAANAGKHILCEKPLAMDQAEAQSIIDAAKANDVFMMEAFMYRCHPQTAKLVELIQEDAIGRVRMVQSTFSFSMDPKRVVENGDCRLWNAEGGGAMMDVGCYCSSLTRLAIGTYLGVEGKHFADPINLTGHATFHKPEGPNKVDMAATASAIFPGRVNDPNRAYTNNGEDTGEDVNIVASLTTGFSADASRDFYVYGETGFIHIEDPWFAHECRKISIQRTGETEPEAVLIEEDGKDLYTTEVESVTANIANRQVAPPGHTWDDSISNMRMLDMWRAAVGLEWEQK
jgi:predicted dehydrogenase